MMQSRMTVDQEVQIRHLMRSGKTLVTANRGGWNGGDLHAVWIDYSFDPSQRPTLRMAQDIIDFLARQPMPTAK